MRIFHILHIWALRDFSKGRPTIFLSAILLKDTYQFLSDRTSLVEILSQSHRSRLPLCHLTMPNFALIPRFEFTSRRSRDWHGHLQPNSEISRIDYVCAQRISLEVNRGNMLQGASIKYKKKKNNPKLYKK